MPTLLACLLALLALSCSEPASLQSAGLCEVAVEEEPGADWHAWPAGRLTVRLPPSFRPILEPERRYIHGGYQWRDGDSTVELIWGHWGPASLEPSGGGQWCLAEIGRSRVGLVELTDETRLAAWYLTDPDSTEPMLQAASASGEDRERLWRILRAQRLFEEPAAGEPIGQVVVDGELE